MAAEKITRKYTADDYYSSVGEMAECAANLPEDRRESNISDNIVGTVWPCDKGAILVALNTMAVNPGAYISADTIREVLEMGNAKYYDDEPLWAVLDIAVRVGMNEEIQLAAAEIAKDLPPFVKHDCPEGRTCWDEDCYDGQTRYPEKDE